MRIPFFTKKPDPPQFYKDYAILFTGLEEPAIADARFIVFDTETTGIDKQTDRMLSLGAVELQGNSINLANSLELYVEQEVFSKEAVAIHGILKENSKYQKISEEEAVKQFLKYIGNSVLVGHHIGFDVGIINYSLKRLGAPKLKNRTIDTGVLFKRTVHLVNITNPDKVYSLDELCEELNIARTDRHKAIGDAYITALAFLKILNRLKKPKRLKDLTH
ncbi:MULTISPECIES: 3'-5' exonuclease [unclassified Leeuwenhoekiella]|uniref:3'-5' exonuclease n=1 Tax=unclassified Leeuwenhoekiella TaxID=2615029 RepID=UPI000C5A5D49|nr:MULTISPECIES: 3'-5' exonuclease [unclassified Leeuwenhoekiella]MAS71549.1 DNA polymerase III subunit epsilon [Zunongwangia sp.]MAW96288.1 DNA polymerase III subunit epsilon [Leeuwenhoekiella sp.]MBA82779.1 DNA polymerase III subunit epsilon [Leeuwenhoekiella sp.]|tara:strand:- start:6788 stop:7444 length:657 start_codon:yes stop_codon:yes gene_type:complete